MTQSYAEQSEGSNTHLAEDRAQDIQEQVKAKAGEAVDYLTDEAKKAMADPQAYARDAQTHITSFTQREPLKALAIAAGIAFVIGALSKAGK